MNILVGICSGGTIQAQTAVALVGALDQLKQYGANYRLSIQIGGDKAQGMNRLVKEAIEGEFDYLMSIDADMTFPTGGILRLIENDKDIVGANYAVRGNAVDGHPGEAVIKMANDEGEKIAVPLEKLPKTLFKCHALGNGFTLYKTTVFKAMKAPWFYIREDGEGNWSGEDVLFCERAQAHGFEVWCNPKIHMGHIGSYNYEI